jgi:hypothetical protein
MTTLTESLHAGAYLVSDDFTYSRDQVTIAPNQTIKAGQVLGKTGVPSGEQIVAAILAGAVGNGVATVDPTAPITAAAIDGLYIAEMQTAGATAAFHLLDPAGKLVGEGAVGTLFNGVLKFTISNGGTPFAIGDKVGFSVAREDLIDELYYPLNLAATDGTQNAVAISWAPVVTGSASAAATISARHTEVRLADLTWPAGATSAQISEAIVQLRARGIIPR